MQFALREMRSIFLSPRLWIAFAVVVALFVFTGPFGTFERLSFIERLGFWLCVHLVNWAVALGAIMTVVAFGPRSRGIGLGQVVTGCLLATPLIGLMVELIKLVFLAHSITGASIAWQMLEALPVSLAIGLIAYFFLSTAEQAGQAGNGGGQMRVSGEDASRLMLRLPVQKRGALQHMTMRDHYVEVVTANGSELVLMRMADAIAEIGQDVGLQVHRSHWVAYSAVKSVERANGKTVIVTPAGARLPVSRTYLPALKEAGLLQS